MDAFSKLFNFFEERNLVINDLEKYKFDFAKYPVDDLNERFVIGPRFPKTGKEIEVIIKNIVYYTNHLQDYVRLLAKEKGLLNDFVKNTIEENESLQIISYLSNQHKHATIDRKNWGDQIQPKYGNPFVQYQNLEEGKKIPGFNKILYPTVQLEGHGLLDMKFDIGKVNSVLITVILHDKNDEKIGDAWNLCNEAASIWQSKIEEIGFKI